jgi:hypothetical protein
MKNNQIIVFCLVVVISGMRSTASAQEFASFVQNPFSLTFFSQNAMPCFVDLDGDGDMDMMAGSDTGNFRYYENIGNASSPNFASYQQNPFGITFFASDSSVSFADLDGDGDQDMFSGSEGGNYRYYQNIGNASSPAFAGFVQNPFQLAPFPSYSTPVFVDLDNDNDFDIMAGSDTGNFRYYENVGSSSSPQFANFQQNPFSLQFFAQNSTPSFVDLDEDGDMDMFSGSDTGNFRYYENIGNSSSPSFASFVANPFSISYFPSHSSPAFVDIDNDGDSDLFSGSDFGNYRFYENTSATASIDEAEFQLFASPNPTNGVFEISLKGNASIEQLNVYDISGKNIISSAPFSSRVMLDLSHYQVGVYVVKIFTLKSIRTVFVEKI